MNCKIRLQSPEALPPTLSTVMSKHAVLAEAEPVPAPQIEPQPHPLDITQPIPLSPPPPTLAELKDGLTVEGAKAMLKSMGVEPQTTKPPTPAQLKRKAKLQERADRRLSRAKEGAWVRMKGSKTNKPNQSFHYVDFTTTASYTIHKALAKSIKTL